MSIAPRRLVIVVEKFGSFPNAIANSFKVSNVDGALAIKFETSLLTKAVVAICVVFVPLVAVGAIGVPINVGDNNVAYVLWIYVLL